jgi:hypothetical protein
MATTDARTGFRLPWSSDQRPATDGVVDGGEPDGAPHGDTEFATQSTEGETMIEAVDAATPETAGSGPEAAAHAGATQPGREKRPSKFLADLTRAMQAAAESAREETLARLQADAKAHVEDVHARSATEAADLRRRADDDVAAIREWSKAEIARIREETETRITARKGRLETEIEEHAALIERQIERVQGRVAAFEDDMARFFERLLAEDDPTRFAAMAGSLPEPPPFDTVDLSAAAAAAMVAPDAATEPAATSQDAQGADWTDGPAQPEAEQDPEAAMAAIQAAAEAAAEAEQSAATTAPSEDEASAAPAQASDDETDPRLAALAESPDLAAAEAEAFAAADSTAGEDVEIPTIADEALAARLAGLVPNGEEGATESRSTQVVVTGLVSVASIASFKRHLGRLPGVQSVGVSSGPDGEFVFAVSHGESVDLRDAVPSLPGFAAQVTGGSEESIEVTAKDPENEA